MLMLEELKKVKLPLQLRLMFYAAMLMVLMVLVILVLMVLMSVRIVRH